MKFKQATGLCIYYLDFIQRCWSSLFIIQDSGREHLWIHRISSGPHTRIRKNCSWVKNQNQQEHPTLNREIILTKYHNFRSKELTYALI